MAGFSVAATVAAVAFVVIVAGAWALRDSNQPHGLHIVSAEAAWTESGGQPVVVTRLTIDNPEATEATVRKATILFQVNGETVSNVTRDLVLRIPAHDRQILEVEAAAPAGFASTWWTQHAGNAESSLYKISGELLVDQTGADDVKTFDVDGRWRTDALESLGPEDADCGAGLPDLCLEGIKADWVEGKDGLVLHATLTVSNPNSVAVRLDNATLAVRIGDAEVAAGSIAPGKTVSGHAETSLVFDLPTHTDGLDHWLTRILTRCEPGVTSWDARVDASGRFPAGTQVLEWLVNQAPQVQNTTQSNVTSTSSSTSSTSSSSTSTSATNSTSTSTTSSSTSSSSTSTTTSTSTSTSSSTSTTTTTASSTSTTAPPQPPPLLRHSTTWHGEGPPWEAVPACVA